MAATVPVDIHKGRKRLARRYYRRRHRRSSQDARVTIVLLMAFGLVVFFESVSKQMLTWITVLFGVMISCGAFLLAGVSFWRRHHLRQKQRALTIFDADEMDGLAFERYVVQLLRAQGFRQVKLTEIYDLGVDILARKDGVTWGIQVKRYRNMVKAEAVRQVVTALKHYNCQRAMVVTNSTFSRPAHVLAKSNDCLLVDKEILAEWILAFQRIK